MPGRRGARVKPGDGGEGLRRLDDCVALLGVPRAEFSAAQGLLDLFGDDVRRTLVERIARSRDERIEALARLTQASPEDVGHRLRSLRRAGVIDWDRHHRHVMRAEALKRLARYFDTLFTAAAFEGMGRHD